MQVELRQCPKLRRRVWVNYRKGVSLESERTLATSARRMVPGLLQKCVGDGGLERLRAEARRYVGDVPCQ